AIGPLTLFPYRGRCRSAAQVPEAVPAAVAALPLATTRRLSRPDRFALAAAAEACGAAGLDAGLRRRAALAVGATTGGMFETEEIYRRRRAGEERRFRLSRLLGTPLSTTAAAAREDPGHARARGARAHAALLGHGTATDAHHPTAPHPEGRGALAALRAALAAAGLPPEAIDYVNAHGTGTPQNDAMEVGV